MHLSKVAVITLVLYFLSCSTKPDARFNPPPFGWHTDCTHCPSQKTKNIAVIIEPRKTEPVVEVTHNFIDHLIPFSDWTIQIFHSRDNEEMIKSDPKIAKLIKDGKVILSKLDVDNLTVPLYDRMIYSTKFWQSLQGEESVLIFQTDTGLCPNPQKTLISFLDYDFVGAPWKYAGPLCVIYDIDDKSLVHMLEGGSYSKDEIANKFNAFKNDFHNDKATNLRIHHPKVGNGGLAVNNKQKWIDALNKYSPVSKKPEMPGADLFFACVAADNKDMLVPDEALASDFSMETMKSTRPVGFHKPWLYFNKADLEELGKVCPVLIDVSKKFFAKNWGTDK